MTRKPSIRELVDRCMTDAADILVRHKSLKLYELLGRVAEVCEVARGDNTGELNEIIRQQPLLGRNRTYVNKSTDVYLKVCRLIFHQERHYANTCRYASALREAAVRNIQSRDLSRYLREQGGINSLYLARPLAQTSISTKCLRLAETVHVPKGGTLRLVLEHQPDNTFRVVEASAE